MIFAISISFFGMLASSPADTVIMRNGQKVKGVVVEAYKDRIVLRTIGGEEQIFKQNIKDVLYDLEEQNLTSVADFYLDSERYEQAYYYYQKALEINPDYKRARDGLKYTSAYLSGTGRREKISYIQRLNAERLGRKGVIISDVRNEEQQVRDRIGLVLKDVKGAYQIEEVIPNSPADRADIKKGDILAAIWGRPIRYMQPSEVFQKLLDPGIMEVQITIKRTYEVEVDNFPGGYANLIGAKMGYMEMEGLVVEEVSEGGPADMAGVRPGDIVQTIGGESVRYMPFRDIERAIISKKGASISLTADRDVVMWKRFKGGKI